MDLEKAIGIVKEYGRILREQPIKNVQGRCQSILPYDKDTIKEAIKVELMYAGTAEPRDEKIFSTLQLSFLQLASFLSDDEVVPEFDVEEALENAEATGESLPNNNEAQASAKTLKEKFAAAFSRENVLG